MSEYKIRRTNVFKKDYKRVMKQGLPESEIREVIKALAGGERLNEKYRDHELKGEWSGYRECHIRPDWLLVYQRDEDVLILVLTRTGSHSDIFGE